MQIDRERLLDFVKKTNYEYETKYTTFLLLQLVFILNQCWAMDISNYLQWKAIEKLLQVYQLYGS